VVDRQTESARLAKRLGKRIAEQRSHLEWTQDQLAERVGCDSETISRFERGANLPSLPTLDRLATALQVDVGELLSRATTKANDDASKFSAWLDGLTTKDRSFVMKVVRDCCEHLRQRAK
jgi:transcriptional regulator with XRE-family HTH domain